MTTPSQASTAPPLAAPGNFNALPQAPVVDFSAPGAGTQPSKLPNSVTPTTPPLGTFSPLQIEPDGSVMLYWPETNGFVALTMNEWLMLRDEAQQHVDVIQNLQDANKAVSAAAFDLRKKQKAKASKADQDKAEAALVDALNKVAEASEAAKKKIEPLAPLEAKEGEKMIEMVPLTPKRWIKKDMLDTPIYIRASGIQKALDDRRIYIVDGEAEKRKYPKDKLIKNGRPDMGELKKRMAQKVQDSAAFKGKVWKWPKEGKEKEVSGLLFESWSKKMGGDATQFLERTAEELEKKFLKPESYSKDNAHRMIDLKPEAQLMRWSAGAGLEANFNPFQGTLFDGRDKTTKAHLARGFKSGEIGIKGSAHADFVIGEAKVPATIWLPHFAGWHASPAVLGQQFDLGFYRFMVELDLYGTAGASLAIEVDIGVTYEGGKQGLKGKPKGRAVKGRASADAELNAFAGVKAGIDLKGAFQWLNPEGYIDLDALNKLKPKDAIAEYCDIAKIDTGVAGEAGIGAAGAITIKHEGGKFVIRIKGSLCIGLGGDGHFKFEVQTSTIKAFFKYVAYTLKHADWKKMEDFIDQEAFKLYNKILVMVIAKKEALEKYVDQISKDIDDSYNRFIDQAHRRGQEYLDSIHGALKDWGIIAYLPPESRGAMLAFVNEAMMNPEISRDADNREKAGFVVAELMNTQQTPRQLDETLQHMSLEIGNKVDVAMAEASIRNITTGTAYDGCLDQCRVALAGALPVLGKPFMRNDEPSFIAATFPVHDTAYT